MPVAIVIPARFASSRYPGKPLVQIRGATGVTLSLIHRSWAVASAVPGVDRVIVATDDDRIAGEARSFGAEVVMTSESCRNGTARCAEVARKLPPEFDIIVNFQGDAPLTPPWFVTELVDNLTKNDSWGVTTPVLRCSAYALEELRADRLAGRVGATTAVFDRNGRALYFSKEVLPFAGRGLTSGEEVPVFHHVGVYAFRRETLSRYPGLERRSLEEWEGLEQLCFLENGIDVHCVEVFAPDRAFWELNNPSDLGKVEAHLFTLGIE